MDIKQIIEGSVRNTLRKNGKLSSEGTRQTNKKTLPSKKTVKKLVTEALAALPQTFSLQTEKLSDVVKNAHEQLYQALVNSFNKTSASLDGANVHEANSENSEFRSLKMAECYNLNGIKLHELYFHNIADPASEINVDALPYMRLARDYGTFENWQFDFMATCNSSRSGWAVLVYEPYKDVYMNVTIDSHDKGLPLGAIPVLVMDMWEHSYLVDYESRKTDYVVSMMREINWSVVEARMVLAERSDLSALYMIKPIYNSAPQKMLDTATSPAPIDQVTSGGDTSAPPTTPPGPENYE